WLLDHEDLAAANITMVTGENYVTSRPHGTSVLGQVVMQDNNLGGVGIAPAAGTGVAGGGREGSPYTDGLVGGIVRARNGLGQGDVILIEQQAIDGDNPGPVEVDPRIFSAIELAVRKGVIVVEAGGNKGTDLDAWTDPRRGKIFNRKDRAFKDSGAIMVGAC